MKRGISTAIAGVLVAAGAGSAGAATARNSAAAPQVTDRTLRLTAIAMGNSEETYYVDEQRFTTSLRALYGDDPYDRVPRGVTVKIKLSKTKGSDDFCVSTSSSRLKHLWAFDPSRWTGAKRDAHC